MDIEATRAAAHALFASHKSKSMLVRDECIKIMSFLYFVIKASESLLLEAAKLARGDLKKYYLDHLKEEKNHSQWLAEDLQTAGINVDELETPERARRMVGAIYYSIFHEDPAALLGYMLFLEGNPKPLAAVEHLERLHGVLLMRTLRHHSEHDPEHGRNLFVAIAKLPESRQKYVGEIAYKTARAYGRAMETL